MNGKKYIYEREIYWGVCFSLSCAKCSTSSTESVCVIFRLGWIYCPPFCSSSWESVNSWTPPEQWCWPQHTLWCWTNPLSLCLPVWSPFLLSIYFMLLIAECSIVSSTFSIHVWLSNWCSTCVHGLLFFCVTDMVTSASCTKCCSMVQTCAL